MAYLPTCSAPALVPVAGACSGAQGQPQDRRHQGMGCVKKVWSIWATWEGCIVPGTGGGGVHEGGLLVTIGEGRSVEVVQGAKECMHAQVRLLWVRAQPTLFSLSLFPHAGLLPLTVPPPTGAEARCCGHGDHRRELCLPHVKVPGVHTHAHTHASMPVLTFPHAPFLPPPFAPCPSKVLKPGVEDVVTTDMNFVYLMSRYLEFIQPEASRLSLTGVRGKNDSGAMWVVFPLDSTKSWPFFAYGPSLIWSWW